MRNTLFIIDIKFINDEKFMFNNINISNLDSILFAFLTFYMSAQFIGGGLIFETMAGLP